MKAAAIGVVVTTLLMVATLGVGCAENAAYLYETQKVGLSIESRPDPSMPVAGTLGVKQRVAAVVPSQSVGGSAGTPGSDAVSVISTFAFDKRPARSWMGLGPVDLRAGLITGRAARSLAGKGGTAGASDTGSVGANGSGASRAAEAALAITPTAIRPARETIERSVRGGVVRSDEHARELGALLSREWETLREEERARIEALAGVPGQLRTPREEVNRACFAELRAAFTSWETEQNQEAGAMSTEKGVVNGRGE